MNEQLKFSWGHIIAFVALIFISYVSFVGVTYITDGNFTTASIAMVVIDVILLVFFIGSQMLKATTKKFRKRIWIERFFVFSSPFIFICCMVPFYHFGTVQSREDEIVNNFIDAVSASKQMFYDYDSYSEARIANYECILDYVINNQSTKPGVFVSFGFTKGKEQIQKNNMVNTLRLLLYSENYKHLKNEAITWIESSSNGVSTWNVFLLGNVKEIETAIKDWNLQLIIFSEKKLINEEYGSNNKVNSFAENSISLSSVEDKLDGLTDKFTHTAFPSVFYILVSIVLYLALLFPYILQDRNTKSLFRLIGSEKSTKGIYIDQVVFNETEKQDIKVDSFENEDGVTVKSDEDYKSFTIE